MISSARLRIPFIRRAHSIWLVTLSASVTPSCFAIVKTIFSIRSLQAWSIGQVKEILKDETYIGNSIHNKQTNISYKNKKKIRKPKEEWVRIENTHEAIISKDVFYHVQNQIASRRRKQKDGTSKILSGLVKCADCGWSLAYGENRQNKTPYGHYHCSNYGQGTGKCSMHYVRYDTLYTYVLLRVQHWTKAVREDEERLLESILKAGDKEKNCCYEETHSRAFQGGEA